MSADIKKTIVIAGGSGLVGKALISHIDLNRYEVTVLSRESRATLDNGVKFAKWLPSEGSIDLEFCPNIIINLAGEGIADSRWSVDRKRRIINSRVESARTIAKFLKNNNYRPDVYISASAIGYYGNRGDELLTEASSHGEGFLSESCQAWEDAASLAGGYCERYTILRIGIVLSMLGGALPKMLMTKGFGIYNYFGDGSQYYSWIHIDDLCRMFITSIENPSVRGIFNAVSPLPCTNKDFMLTAMKALKSKGLLLPAPKLALEVALGEMSAVVLDSARVSSAKWEGVEGYQFQYGDLIEALNNLNKE